MLRGTPVKSSSNSGILRTMARAFIGEVAATDMLEAEPDLSYRAMHRISVSLPMSLRLTVRLLAQESELTSMS